MLLTVAEFFARPCQFLESRSNFTMTCLQKEELLVFEMRRGHEVVDVRLEVGLLRGADNGGHVEHSGTGAEVVRVVRALVEAVLVSEAGDATEERDLSPVDRAELVGLEGGEGEVKTQLSADNLNEEFLGRVRFDKVIKSCYHSFSDTPSISANWSPLPIESNFNPACRESISKIASFD